MVHSRCVSGGGQHNFLASISLNQQRLGWVKMEDARFAEGMKLSYLQSQHRHAFALGVQIDLSAWVRKEDADGAE